MALVEQVKLFNDAEFSIESKLQRGNPVKLLNLDVYDKILISLSGGKDSMASLMYLLDLGVDPSKIELVHQAVDGSPEEQFDFMDWPVTHSYNQAVSDYFGIPISFQWREGGIRGEMLRKESLTGDVYQIAADGTRMHLPTTKGKSTTRRKWPAMSADLNVRWCSAYAKIDVFRKILNNLPEYKGTIEDPKKLLVISGERREESPNRAKYNEAELHPSHTKSRLVHWWRPVIDWKEEQIWDIFEKHKIRPMTAYYLGWSRTSCMSCIFSTADLWKMLQEIVPERFNAIAEMERELGHTIDPKMDVVTKASMGSLDRLPTDERCKGWVEQALSRNFTKEDLVMENWELPCGAFKGASGGPV